MEARLLDVLVCPVCKGPLTYKKENQELICYGDKLAFPVRDDIPLMWVEEARTLSADEVDAR
ncbi:Trm112 family protein [Undibacterium rugosum]|uniref:Trm112 family protein n=1 Tax=Undibacterium rugosum TaxID=2762291 RepID=UPI001B82A48F|nr:Trm112 family protein [Undibacterium rugosum]MBR7780002.1 Trm112 family protein [Undibacterium rugosum]